MIGILTFRVRVRKVLVLALEGNMDEAAGINETSSNVRPNCIELESTKTPRCQRFSTIMHRNTGMEYGQDN